MDEAQKLILKNAGMTDEQIAHAEKIDVVLDAAYRDYSNRRAETYFYTEESAFKYAIYKLADAYVQRENDGQGTTGQDS